MKQSTLVTLCAILAVTICGCGSGNKSKQIKDYKYTEEKAAVNDSIPTKAESWITEGMTCYGVIISLNSWGKAIKVCEIEAKVISIQPGLIKMKALEDLAMVMVQGCDKVRIKKGETWDEKEGELFRTREEAVKFIKIKYPGLQYIYE